MAPVFQVRPLGFVQGRYRQAFSFRYATYVGREPPTPQVILNHAFGEKITLLGYDMTDDNGQPIDNTCTGTTGGSGRTCPKSKIENLKLRLYWQTNGPPDRDYTTFLHLRDRAGQNVAQKDSPPAGGLYPTSLWDTGEIIVDDITLPLADVPPGNYGLVVGLYDYTSGGRLPVDGDPAGELELQEVLLP